MNRSGNAFRLLTWLMGLLLTAFVVGCGGGGGGGGTGPAPGSTVVPGAVGTPGAAATNPTVGSASPASGATNVATGVNGSGNVVTGTPLTATFSEAMDSATVTAVGTFTLKQTVAGTNVPGTVTMNAGNTIATFTPAAALLPGTQYTATVSTAAKNAGGTAMPNPVSWSFTTNATALNAQAPVNLGTAGNFAILTKTGISTTGATLVTGDIGVSPGAASLITGFTLAPAPTTSTTAPEVVGLVYAADYNPPTPANLTTAVSNMETAYTEAAGRTPGVGPNLNLGGGTVAGQTLTPGVYTWGSNVTITTDLTLSGGANDVWIFQVTGTLGIDPGKKVLLAGGAQAKNVFWQATGAVTLGAGSHFEGIILAQTNIAMITGASINGRLLAQTAATLQANAVTQPAP